VHPLAHNLLEHIRRLEVLQAGDRVGVAVSGGSDSVGLLRLLLELRSGIGLVLSVVHFNHKLRGAESDEDEAFVASLARRHELELHSTSADVKAAAASEGSSIEAVARELRYQFFTQLAARDVQGHSYLDKIATGHTLDDQAETVLMRAIRGTGMRGLAGIYPTFDLEQDDELVGQVVRPLLETRHHELHQYLKDIGQSWREDSSNLSPQFTRNRVRHLLLPLLEREFNPATAESLNELAEIARAEQDYWQGEISGWMGTAIHWAEPKWAARGQQGLVQLRPADPTLQHRLNQPGPLVMNATVDLLWLLSEPLAVQRRAIKAVGELAGFPLEFKHVEAILRFAADAENDGKSLSLPLGWKLLREPAALTFVTPDPRNQERVPLEYEYAIPLPGRAIVPEAGIVIEAVAIQAGSGDGYNPERLLSTSALPGNVVVRNWRPGDRYWPAHTKAAKKVKELLQERHVSGQFRKAWPVLASGEQILWLRGFPLAVALQAKPGENAILIRERSIEE
jgi:tRNA(Ile)-lysidine synthase